MQIHCILFTMCHKSDFVRIVFEYVEYFKETENVNRKFKMDHENWLILVFKQSNNINHGFSVTLVVLDCVTNGFKMKCSTD